LALEGEGLRETVSRAHTAAGAGGRARYLVGSVAEEATARRVVADVLATEGKLDVLINMAGILRSEPTTSTSLGLFRQLLEVTPVGTFLFCREALPALLQTRGNIVNAASTSAQFGHPYMAAYSASKGGVFAMTRALAREYLKLGERMGELDMSLFQHLSRPDGVFGKPESVAAVIAMLASDDGANLTAEVVKVDGGVHN
jgi:NAD(P)-dependent dehydrogenase (short-subunit alcohol dehydrogenase family)